MIEPLTTFNRQHVSDVLTYLHEPGAVMELRHPKLVGDGWLGHYSQDQMHMIDIAEYLDTKVLVYLMLNPIKVDMAAKGDNNTRTTTNKNIEKRRWLLLDCDPERTTKTAATDAEFNAARLKAKDVIATLSGKGWPAPAVAYSGNGVHIIYPCEFDNSPESDLLFEAVTKAISRKFSDARVKIDDSVHNAGRILKLHGTKSVKGADNDPERPQRYSQMVAAPVRDALLTEPQMREVIEAWGEVKKGPGRPKRTDFEAQATQTGKSFDMAGWLASHGIGVKSVEREAARVKFVLDHCVFNPEHQGKDAAVFLHDDGTRGHRCLHTSCSGNDWKVLRAKFEPAYALDQAIQSKLAETELIVSGSKPVLRVNSTDKHDLTLNAVRVLATYNSPPNLFQRSGLLAVLQDTEAGKELVPLTPERLCVELTKRVNCVTVTRTETGDRLTPAWPDKNLLNSILTLNVWEGIPHCDNVVTVPVIASDGTIQSRQGYDPATRSYLATDEFAFHRNPATVSREDALAARDWLLSWPLSGFPFFDAASRSNAVAALLGQPLCRIIADNTPLFLLDASRPGSGKGLLAEVISYAAGKKPGTIVLPVREEEVQKTIVSTLLKRPTHVLIDNVRGLVNSPSLEALITARTFSSRLLGVSENVDLCNTQTCWMLAANNATFSPDLTTRACYVRLEPEVADPTKRTDFKIADLPQWLFDHRIEVVHAVLTILSYWINSGMKRYTGTRTHRLYQWRQVVGGVLESIDMAGDFLANADDLIEAADPETPAWNQFVGNWLGRFGTKVVSAKDLVDSAFGEISDPVLRTRSAGAFESIMATPEDKRLAQKLGMELKSKLGAIYEGHKITVAKSDGNANQFRLTPTAEAGIRKT